jgi:type IV pilus assembly protein PilM
MSVLLTRLSLAFSAPRYLAPRVVGIDLSTSAVKMARLAQMPHGLVLDAYAELRLPSGAASDGEIIEPTAAAEVLAALAKEHHVTHAAVSLPESKSYLFETLADGETKQEWFASVEPRIEEFVPLSPATTVFDVAAAARQGTQTLVVGVGYARRVVENLLATFDAAGITIHALEGENFALARSLLIPGDPSTILVIDIGKTTTKFLVVGNGLPRFATTIGIGGHSLTLAVQKHFGVTEEEAKKVKAERGIVPSAGNEDYIAAMLSTVSAIRDEIAQRLAYWQTHAALEKGHEPVSRMVLVGGNASVRGLPEYLEGALRIPVSTGDVFANLASRDYWLPPLDYLPSLAYGTAIGLALRRYAP